MTERTPHGPGNALCGKPVTHGGKVLIDSDQVLTSERVNGKNEDNDKKDGEKKDDKKREEGYGDN